MSTQIGNKLRFTMPVFYVIGSIANPPSVHGSWKHYSTQILSFQRSNMRGISSHVKLHHAYHNCYFLVTEIKRLVVTWNAFIPRLLLFVSKQPLI